MPDYEYILKSLKEKRDYLVGIEKTSVEYKIRKMESIISGVDHQFMIKTTRLVSQGRLIEKINKEKNFIKGYKKLLMCDNTFLGNIEDRLQFNKIKVMLYEKEIPYYECSDRLINDYTFQKTNGSLSLCLLGFEMDPIFEVTRIDIYIDLKLSSSLQLVKGNRVDVTFENSSEMEIFLLDPNGPVLGVLYFPCEFFVNRTSSVLELDFRNFNYLKVEATFNNDIRLVRQNAKILYIYKEGHQLEDLYTYTPRICGVCEGFIALFSYCYRCKRCKFTSHKTCANWILFHCKNSIEIDNKQFKKSYDIAHLLSPTRASGFRYCSHCGDRINTSNKFTHCQKCKHRYHEECEINIFNSCGITLDLRKSMAEFIPPIPKNMKPHQTRSISDYRVIRVLGKGNFGKVILAQDKKMIINRNSMPGGKVEGKDNFDQINKQSDQLVIKSTSNEEDQRNRIQNNNEPKHDLTITDQTKNKPKDRLTSDLKNIRVPSEQNINQLPSEQNNNQPPSEQNNNQPPSEQNNNQPPSEQNNNHIDKTQLIIHYTTSISNLVALKILRKEKIVNISDVAYIEVERKILELAAYYKHPFLMQMYYCFQDSKALYFACEYLAGGDLFTHTVRNSFNNTSIRLYAAEILLALDFLHNKHYIYRDLKLDNILLAEDGHVKICDFGLCKEGIGPLAYTYTYCGTLDTIAPEIIRGEPYTKAVDWWSYGVVLYELYERRPPFAGATNSELSRAILDTKPVFSKTPQEARDLISRLLCSTPHERFGFGPEGVEKIKNHKYFEGVNWKDFYEKKEDPVFKPGSDLSNFEENFLEESVVESPTFTNHDYDQYFMNFK